MCCPSRKRTHSICNHVKWGGVVILYNRIEYKLPKKALFKDGTIKKNYLLAIKNSYNNLTREKAIELADRWDIQCLIAI